MLKSWIFESVKRDKHNVIYYLNPIVRHNMSPNLIIFVAETLALRDQYLDSYWLLLIIRYCFTYESTCDVLYSTLLNYKGNDQFMNICDSWKIIYEL